MAPCSKWVIAATPFYSEHAGQVRLRAEPREGRLGNSVMKESVSNDARKRLARIAGQVTGLQKMVDEERYCVDILTQVAALRAALDQFGVLMLSTHLENCVYGHDGEDHDECRHMSPEERLAEIKVTLNRFLK
jgi:CsoR family transcriptional regulator, copper-sensing transcriptional repressor